MLHTLTVGPLEENCYLVADPETRKAVIIDPGDEPDRILGVVTGEGLEVTAILLTHTHFDHVGAVDAVREATGAEVYAPDGEQAMMEMASDMGAIFGYWIDGVPKVDHWLASGATVGEGLLQFRVVDLHGHSPAGIGYVGTDVVFPGDALFRGSIGRTDLPGGDQAALVDAIRRNLLTLADETVVYPGHGPATTIAEERRSNPFLQI